MDKRSKIIEQAWKFYCKWRENPPYSPAFKAKIVISRQGWLHISGAYGGKKRTFADIYRRLKLLPKAKEIIETSTTIQNVTKKGKDTCYALEAMVMVEENDTKALRKVRVILIENTRGKKTFYSVMDRKPRKKHK